MERLDWIEGEGFEALRGQRAALVDGPVYTLLDPTKYADAVGEGDRARLVIVHTKPESATLSIDVGENAELLSSRCLLTRLSSNVRSVNKAGASAR